MGQRVRQAHVQFPSTGSPSVSRYRSVTYTTLLALMAVIIHLTMSNYMYINNVPHHMISVDGGVFALLVLTHKSRSYNNILDTPIRSKSRDALTLMRTHYENM